ncbi:MAG TPA: hypothetical protein ACFYEM_02535 [Candidatus Hypogeohydataceae bacterium YC40]
MALPKISLERLPQFAKILLLIVPMTIVFVLLNLLVLGPKAGRLETAKGEVNKLYMEIIRDKQQLATFKPFSEEETKEIAETKESFQLMTKSLRTVREVYDKITKKAVSCGISDLSIDPSYRPLQVEEILSMETQFGMDKCRSFLKLNFHSDLKSLGCFLTGLTGGEDHLIIESLTIKRELPKPSVELVLKLFTKS